MQDKIRKLRLKKNLTQDELAEKLGVPCDWIRKVENGSITFASVKVIKALADVLEVRIDDLF